MGGSGRCLCGAVAFSWDGPALWCAHCHCGSCRRQTASAFATFVAVPRGRFRWTGAAPAVFASSDGVSRRFCAGCGTPVAYENDRYADEIHLYLALLDAGAERPLPQRHDFWGERVGWVHLSDDLPKE